MTRIAGSGPEVKVLPGLTVQVYAPSAQGLTVQVYAACAGAGS
jgi:hypothetical protein